MIDEELQNKAEKGIIGNGADERSYRLVFDALRKEPPFTLPANFANKVIHNMRPATQLSESRELVWMYVGIGFFFIAFIICILITGFKFNFGALKFISGYQGLIVFGVAFVLALNWIEKRFIRRAMTN